MKYSVNADNRTAIKDADEYKCKFNRLGDIISLIETTKARLNILYEPEDSTDFNILLDQIKILEKKKVDFVIACKDLRNLHAVLDLEVPAYLNFPISDWETFFNILEWGVSDIWIDGALCFSADAIRKHTNGVNVRMCPHMSANAGFSAGHRSNAYSAFIRPEDVKAYEGFIDILDFQTDNKETEKTLYNIYKRGYFHNDLKELIRQLNINSINNTLVPKRFAEKRLNCGQRCQSPSNSCFICERILNLTNKMEEFMK